MNIVDQDITDQPAAKAVSRPGNGRDSSSIKIISDDVYSRTSRRFRRLGLVAVICALVCGAVSFAIMLGLTPINLTGSTVPWITALNAAFVLLLILLISREVGVLLLARKKGKAASRLHIRIVGLFAIVAALPAIIVAIVASVTLDGGLDRWFEGRTKQIVNSSNSVAEAYLNQSFVSLNFSTLAMATTLDQARSLYVLDRTGFIQLLTKQAKGRGLIGASLIREDGTTIFRAALPVSAPIPEPPADAINDAKEGYPVLIRPGKKVNLVGSILKLKQIPQAYLYVLRNVDPAVMASMRLMQENTTEYSRLSNNRLSTQLTFALLYFGMCLIVLLCAIWMGISVADRIVSPIRRLIGAADEISSGNLAVEVTTSRSEGDLRALGETFNKMTSDLRTQRDEILDTHEQIDQRRRFSEAMLAGVSAGVVGISPQGRVSITNRVARQILGIFETDVTGKLLKNVSPDLDYVFKTADEQGRTDYHKQISLMRDGQERTLNVQVTVEDGEEAEHSSVITIDDITNLVQAQRTSAWADVARRIAHEIKNPLTPIQLSAERIRRRYGKVITEDREVFDQCTDTIIRQVSDIGRMVDEFSSFARMPKPSMQELDLADSIREAVFLLKVAQPSIQFDTEIGNNPLIGRFDPRLMAQALTNIIKNGTEAIEAVENDHPGEGKISIQGRVDGDRIVVDVIDNGKGLPTENRQRLLEPYMTTREKGTGLGLAIVRKVFEEHHGTIELLDSPAVANGGRGAMVRLTLPYVGEPVKETVADVKSVVKPAKRQKTKAKVSSKRKPNTNQEKPSKSPAKRARKNPTPKAKKTVSETLSD